MPLKTPEGYQPFHEQSLPAYLASLPHIAARLGGSMASWRVSEVGDGNVNLVFLVRGPAGAVCVKQSLPYVRLVGESWPLTLERIGFEHQALLEHGRHAGRYVPEVYHHDARRYLIIVECLEPHLILRKGLLVGTRYPRFAQDMGDYLARSLFFTSDLALPAAEKKRGMAVFSANTEMCRIMEDMVFTEPYHVHPRNRWTSPQLDGLAAELCQDVPLKLAVSRLKLHYLTRAEALLHGDLHTGSIMVTQDQTRVIDQEFAFYGPMGFDVGTLLAHLLLGFFSQDGLATAEAPREDLQAWLLETVQQLWSRFHDRFLELWETHARGDAYPAALFSTPAERAALAEERRAWLRRLLAESLAFCGAEMLRRIFGLAHVLELESIPDGDHRAACERACVHLARELLVHAGRYSTLSEVTAAAWELAAQARRKRVA